jgi:hypothetical protein
LSTSSLDATFKKSSIASLSTSDGLSSFTLKIGNIDKAFNVHGVFLISHKYSGRSFDKNFLSCLLIVSFSSDCSPVFSDCSPVPVFSCCCHVSAAASIVDFLAVLSTVKIDSAHVNLQ